MMNLLNLFILPVFLFCNFLQFNDFRNGMDATKESPLKANSQISYLFFKIEKNSSGLEKITLEEKKTTKGKLKSMPIFNENEAKVGDFIATLTDANGKEIVKQIVEDPLNPVLETYEEDNKISKNKVSLQSAEFSIRYPHSEKIEAVRIEKVTAGGSQLLFNQKL